MSKSVRNVFVTEYFPSCWYIAPRKIWQPCFWDSGGLQTRGTQGNKKIEPKMEIPNHLIFKTVLADVECT
jgi:hypothetical protein